MTGRSIVTATGIRMVAGWRNVGANTRVGEAVVKAALPVYDRFRKVLIGFSQGGYLSYRMVLEHPDVFDAAVLNESFVQGRRGCEDHRGLHLVRIVLWDGDHTIPRKRPAYQQCVRCFAQNGRLFHTYARVGPLYDEEIARCIRGYSARSA